MAAVASSSERLFDEAKSLHKTLVQLNNEISQKTPEEQLQQLESVVLNEQSVLDNLQNKVNSFFSRQQYLDGGDCEAISNKLSESVTLMKEFSQLQDQLLECGDLFTEAQDALQSKKQVDLRSLQQRVAQKMTGQNISPALLNQLTLLQTNLSEALKRPVQVQPSSATALPTNVSEIKELWRKYQELWCSWTSSQLEVNERAFKIFLPFFKEVRSFSQTYSADASFQDLHTKTYNLLYRAYEAQAGIENANQGQRSTSSASTNTQTLIKELKNCVKEINSPKGLAAALQKTNAPFAKLTEHEKKRFFDELNKIKTIPAPMLKQPLNLWHASLEQKIQAAESAFSGNVQSAAPTAPSKAEAMLKALEAVINSSPAQAESNFSAINQVVQNRARSLQQLLQAAQSQSQEDTGLVGQLMGSVNTLQECLSLFKRSTSQNTLGTVVQILKPLNCTCIFAMSGSKPHTIGKRPFFHIYQIHCVETPQVVRKDDPNYGEKAFANENEATYAQRLRALQRSVVEVCLSGLEEAVNFEDWPSVIDFQNILEAIEPENTKNYAHMLFGAYHERQLEARKTNTALADPNVAEFGRNNLKRPGEDVPSSIKIEAIKQIINSLKEAWKI